MILMIWFSIDCIALQPAIVWVPLPNTPLNYEAIYRGGNKNFYYV